MSKYIGKRFVFATIAILCATATTMYLHYPADAYLKILLVICGVFTASQTVTDIKEKHNGYENLVKRENS